MKGEERAVAKEQRQIDTGALHTRASLAAAFADAGLRPGQTVLMHSALGSVGGWIVGGAVATVQAVLDVLGPTGTLMVPTHTSSNSDPANWQHPPVPEAWWPTIREQMPAYHPALSVPRLMGVLAETVWRWPGALRSDHPQDSFAAVGPNAAALLANHTDLLAAFGEGSPLARLVALDGDVFLFGVGHDNSTLLHLAEDRTHLPKLTFDDGCAMFDDKGARVWRAFQNRAYDSDDFDRAGAAYEAAHPDAVRLGRVGNATTRLLRARPYLDFAVGWLERNRLF